MLFCSVNAYYTLEKDKLYISILNGRTECYTLENILKGCLKLRQKEIKDWILVLWRMNFLSHLSLEICTLLFLETAKLE